MKAFAATGQRHKAETMCEHLILDDGGIVIHKDEFDSDGRNFGNEDTAKCIGNGGVKADEREGRIEWVVFVELDSEILSVFRKKQRLVFFVFIFIFFGGGRGGIGGGKGFLVGTLSNFLRLQELSSPG